VFLARSVFTDVGQHHKTMAENYISVIDVAKEVDKAKQTVFKVLKRLDIESQKMRGPDSHGQLIAYIMQEEFTLIKAEIQNMRGGESDASKKIWNQGLISDYRLMTVLPISYKKRMARPW